MASVTIDRRRVAYEDRGDGPPILLVHGFPLSRRLWDGVVAGLEAGFRCIAPDLRGHGGSEPTARAAMSDYADDLARLLDEIGERRPVVLVGMSMGGYVAFELCRRHAERVRALVLTSTRAGADTAEAAHSRLDTADRVRVVGSALVADAMLDKLFAPGAPDGLKEEWREIMAATPPEGVAAALEAMASRPDSFDTLRAVDRPVLIVTGDQDRITPPSDAEEMHRAAPGSRLGIVAGGGHMTAVEKPGELLALLRPFLEELTGS